MRPENLKPPFEWDARLTIIHDRIWYAPGYSTVQERFEFPGWEHADLFGNRNPIYLEYCSGNGAWIAAKALAYPHINWIAVERKFTRVRKIWSKVKNHHLKNLIVICGEGHHVTSQFFPTNSISEVFINFPDPWPKKRHAKNRLIQRDFVNELHRILMTDGRMNFVTDDAPYSEWTIETMMAYGSFKSCYSDPFYVHEHADYGNSYFDSLWREKGRMIRYHQFKKV
jgi:tRNA (guanine-N7-)-methyltransferase